MEQFLIRHIKHYRYKSRQAMGAFPAFLREHSESDFYPQNASGCFQLLFEPSYQYFQIRFSSFNSVSY